MTLDQAIAEAAGRIDERIASGSKIAPINFSSSSDKFSSYVLDELTAYLVDSGKLIVVDRKEIDLIRDEFKFQLSGEVGDDPMQDLGRMLGAQSIISGSLTDMDGFYRIVIRVLNVQNASVEVQYRTNIINDAIVTALLNGGKSGGVVKASSGKAITSSESVKNSVEQTEQALGQPQTQPLAQTPLLNSGTVQTPQKGTVIDVEGKSLIEKLAWLEDNVTRNTEYRVIINSNESLVPWILSYSGMNNIIIRLISNGEERVISHSGGKGYLLIIESGVTLILDNGITLKGRDPNNTATVMVNSGGNLIMNAGSKITGNIRGTGSSDASAGGGVFVAGNAKFTMTGGKIHGNSAWHGGGVCLGSNASFILIGGEIYGNKADQGGGVYFGGKANFNMTGGEIYANTTRQGGGVYLSGNFLMQGGEISGNTVRKSGGGVYISLGGTFSMQGGEISGNKASSGAGVFIASLYYTTFTKTGGIIYSSNGDSNDNIATKEGHVVGGSNKIRNSTAGLKVNLDTGKSGAAGGWEN